LGDEGRSGGVVSRHFNDLDAILESDPSNDFRQLVFSFQSPPGFRGSGDELEHHQLGGRRRQGPPLTMGNFETIVALAARHRLPAIYPYKYVAIGGGLISYGADNDDLTRKTAQYADRILKGEKLADLPVMQPIKFELVINAKAAKALGLTIPETLLATADEVIQ
jgi:putative tryptophan/tyrosine transport system substrate-binding protein